MKGNIFTCQGEGSPDKQQHLKTVVVLEERVNKTFSCPQDVASVFESFEIVQLVQPANLTKEECDADMGKKMIWEKSTKNHMKRKHLMESNAIAIHAVVWGAAQPHDAVQARILRRFRHKEQSM
jgi:predicted DNA-binding protein (UPF0251 family)